MTQEKELTFQVASPHCFWAGAYHIRLLLPILTPLVTLFRAHGYEEKKAGVGGGVRERDTGYMDFGKAYDSYTEMERRLLRDFEEAEARLDGLWFDELNFEYVLVNLTKGKDSALLLYKRGRLSIVITDSELRRELAGAITEIVTPHLRENPTE